MQTEGDSLPAESSSCASLSLPPLGKPPFSKSGKRKTRQSFNLKKRNKNKNTEKPQTFYKYTCKNILNIPTYRPVSPQNDHRNWGAIGQGQFQRSHNRMTHQTFKSFVQPGGEQSLPAVSEPANTGELRCSSSAPFTSSHPINQGQPHPSPWVLVKGAGS